MKKAIKKFISSWAIEIITVFPFTKKTSIWVDRLIVWGGL